MAVRRGAHVLELREQQPPPPLLRRAPPYPIDEPLLLRRVPALPPQLHPAAAAAAAAAAALEDRLAAQHRNIQALLLDNQRFAATHVALRQELDKSRHELRVAAAAAARARAERDAEARGVFERSLRVEAEARGVEGMRAELDHVRGDVQRLAAARDEHLDRLQGLKSELARARAEIARVSALRSEIEAMQREIQKGRAAVEFEKKAHAENLEQSQLMESHMVSMAQEIEKLRAELANAEKRARAAAAAAVAANSGIIAAAANAGIAASAANPGMVPSAANPGIVASAANPGIVSATINPGYVVSYGNPEMVYGGSAYGGNTYPDAYGMRQVQMGGAEAYSQYGSLYVSQAPYDAQQTQEHK